MGIIDAGEHDSGDITVAGIGHAHEFGIGVPERSFMRSTTHDKRAKIIALQKKLLAKVVAGEMSTDKALGILGEYVADLITQKIIDLKEPPNTPETIKRKGSSNPLIDSSQLKNSITYEVNR
ncbi:MAG: hypothetical protein GY861_24455 [bacterium]|nr:hypothetical protein [bacterium]